MVIHPFSRARRAVIFLLASLAVVAAHVLIAARLKPGYVDLEVWSIGNGTLFFTGNNLSIVPPGDLPPGTADAATQGTLSPRRSELFHRFWIRVPLSRDVTDEGLLHMRHTDIYVVRRLVFHARNAFGTVPVDEIRGRELGGSIQSLERSRPLLVDENGVTGPGDNVALPARVSLPFGSGALRSSAAFLAAISTQGFLLSVIQCLLLTAAAVFLPGSVAWRRWSEGVLAPSLPGVGWSRARVSLTVVTVATALAGSFLLSPIFTWDTAHYLTLSDVLLGRAPWSEWDTVRGWAYPAWLTWVFRWFGTSSAGMAIAQTLTLVTFACVAFWILQRTLNASFPLVFAFGLWLAFDPLVVGMFRVVLTEHVAALLYVVGIACGLGFFRSCARRRIATAIFLGGLLGVIGVVGYSLKQPFLFAALGPAAAVILSSLLFCKGARLVVSGVALLVGVCAMHVAAKGAWEDWLGRHESVRPNFSSDGLSKGLLLQGLYPGLKLCRENVEWEVAHRSPGDVTPWPALEETSPCWREEACVERHLVPGFETIKIPVLPCRFLEGSAAKTFMQVGRERPLDVIRGFLVSYALLFRLLREVDIPVQVEQLAYRSFRASWGEEAAVLPLSARLEPMLDPFRVPVRRQDEAPILRFWHGFRGLSELFFRLGGVVPLACIGFASIAGVAALARRGRIGRAAATFVREDETALVFLWCFGMCASLHHGLHAVTYARLDRYVTPLYPLSTLALVVLIGVTYRAFRAIRVSEASRTTT